jgi:RimJ/RimL family protein N-acetyltransferase
VTNGLVSFAFNELNLNEVSLGVLADNKPAINVYKKAGFNVETKKTIKRSDASLADEYIMKIQKP